MPEQPSYRSQVLDHLGLVAGMFDELAIGDVLDQATQQNPELRDLTVGEAGHLAELAQPRAEATPAEGRASATHGRHYY